MIASKLKQLRIQKGVTQEALAKVLNVSPQAISKWELSITAPDLSMLVPIADYFGVSVDYLLRKESDNEDPISGKIVEVHVAKRHILWQCDVKNISSRELAQLYLKVYFYDRNNNIVDCTEKFICNLEPGTSKSELLITSVQEMVTRVYVHIKSYKFAP